MSRAVLGKLLTCPQCATAFTIGTITRNNGVLTVTYGSAPATVVTYRIDASNNLTRTVGGSTSVAALNAMRSAPEPPPPEALDSLERVLADFDSARGRLTGQPPAES